MAQLDERTRSDLARLRDRGAPSVEAKQRMLAALEARLGPGGGDDDPGGDPGPELGPELVGNGSGGLVWAVKVAGATAGLTAGGLVALRLGAELVRALSATPQVDAPRATEPSIEIASARDRDEVEIAAPETMALDEAIEPARPSPRPSVTTPNRRPKADTLAAELALLEAAHAARDPAVALRELERHLAQFPRGELADERELLRVETLCRLDRHADARALSERLLLERPSSALRRRLASACPAAEKK
ncbi:MAG TPA: hypothetical protein VM869_15710 [Enhygromyxa sp.]|nr:hypothetical protein [Enhygromyxa sp.]